jgi:transposase
VNAGQEMEKGWKYHKISVTAVETSRKKKGGGLGRPRKDEATQTLYRIKVAFEEDKAAIEKETLKKLREALEKGIETIPDQRNKPTKKPTIRRVFQVFESITVLYRGSVMVKIMNLRPIHLKVLSLLGREYERMYCTCYG